MSNHRMIINGGASILATGSVRVYSTFYCEYNKVDMVPHIRFLRNIPVHRCAETKGGRTVPDSDGQWKPRTHTVNQLVAGICDVSVT